MELKNLKTLTKEVQHLRKLWLPELMAMDPPVATNIERDNLITK
jgi:hypothetical protein